MAMLFSAIKKSLVAIFILFILTQSVLADPRPILTSMINQLQTGQLNQSWYSPALWQTIAQQTNGTGVYPQLQQLGAVQQVVIQSSQGFPQGNVFKLNVQHQNGSSEWIIGIGNFSNQIDFANFNIIGSNTPPLPSLPNPTSTPTPHPQTPTTPDANSCQLYPDMC
ncbi:hypothetical protein [Enterobacter asburiae]|uniref:hypothetical protein n=1 Tax=Enterobacter asburiae TaxID=61645 RepID=UPI000B041F12|nr:hypothetical protein [Enterobacter asburiae]